MLRSSRRLCDWNAVYEMADRQHGYFTRREAARLGCSPQLQQHHLRRGIFRRVMRGILRLSTRVEVPHEWLTVLFLWSRREGVFSHGTARMLLGLGPAPTDGKIHMSAGYGAFPWRAERVPPELRLHYGGVPPSERLRIGPIPITTAKRTLADLVVGLAPDDEIAHMLTEGSRLGYDSRDDVWRYAPRK